MGITLNTRVFGPLYQLTQFWRMLVKISWASNAASNIMYFDLVFISNCNHLNLNYWVVCWLLVYSRGVEWLTYSLLRLAFGCFTISKLRLMYSTFICYQDLMLSKVFCQYNGLVGSTYSYWLAQGDIQISKLRLFWRSGA